MVSGIWKAMERPGAALVCCIERNMSLDSAVIKA